MKGKEGVLNNHFSFTDCLIRFDSKKELLEFYISITIMN